jgi:phospholipase C
MTKLRSLLLLALLVSVSHASLIDSVSDALTPIKHIVVLMMENRSFDHLLGWLMTDYTSRIDGLKPGTSMPRDPRNPGLGSVPITRGGYDVAPCDPHHDFAATHQQIDGGAMDGFVWNTRSLGLNESNPVVLFLYLPMQST